MFAVQRQTAGSRERESGKRAPERAYASAQPMLAVQRASCACGGGCPRCREKYPLQAKLEVSQPGDALEQEADRIAEQVLRMQQPELPDNPDARESIGLRLSRYASGAPAEGSPEVPSIVHDVVRSPGEPLDTATRAFMEPRFGQDFSRVRVHSGSVAEQSARGVNAKAYAVGHDIVFGAGGFAPGTHEGRRLIAHELAHVVQQAGGARSASVALQRQRFGSDTDPIHAPLIEEYRRAHGLPLSGRDPATDERVGPSEAELKYGGVLDAWLRTRGGGTAPASGCPPTVLNPQWDVAATPILMNFPGSRCAMHLAKRFAPMGSAFGVNGMEFTGQLRVPSGCPGRFYFVQYTQPDRASVGCLEGRELAECVRPGWGRDGSWPYSFGSTVDTAARAGATVDVTSFDSPGIRRISSPDVGWVRHCISDEQFVTYLVFEDAAGTLTSLGWMNWKWSARALLGQSGCPPASTQPDCTDWTLTGTGSKLGESFAPGAIGPQPLNRATAAVSLLSSSCPPGNCPVSAPAAAPPPSTTGTHAE